MKFQGGYNVLLAGRPAADVSVLPDPEKLFLPLQSERFRFSELCVSEGKSVKPGQALAKDPDHYSVPLLAPRAGTVRLEEAEGHVVLADIRRAPEEPYDEREEESHAPRNLDSQGKRRYKLLALGAWQFFRDAFRGGVPDPFGQPSAVVVSTLALEPFLARGDVQLHKRLKNFTHGLEHLQGLLEYEPIFLALPREGSHFGRQVRDAVRGYAFVRTVEVPMRCGLDRFPVLAKSLGLRPQEGASVWCTDAAGVLAVDRALTLSLPSTVRIVSVGGPAAVRTGHLKAMLGYPVADILKAFGPDGGCRALMGGALTGRPLGPDTLGLDADCQGITLLPDPQEREFLGFLRPGADRRSYSRCFLSALRPPASERLNAALRGERRACVACGYCEEVCPAGILPFAIHKAVYKDAMEEADKLRPDLCVRCGLCSFACPSKIELMDEIVRVDETLVEEKSAAAAAAAEAEE